MKLTFLGTGAADWDINAYVPGQCHRRFSSVLIHSEAMAGDLLIDPGPHIFHFAEQNGTPALYDNVRNVLVTHTHADHFTPETVERLCAGRDCTLWGDPVCMKKLIHSLGAERASRIRFVETTVCRPFPYMIGGYTVYAMRSNHDSGDPTETTRLYVIGDGERMLYYGCDSAWIPTASWNVIKDLPLNVMVLEATCGETARNDWRIFEHNTLEMLELMLTTFRKYHYFAPDVRFYTSHMARTLHTDHETLKAYLAPLGVTPAYDGMVIDV